ncbi:MAG: tRNA uridine-5-carboxymethylaminomethyl(34) synthesis GTPase MnmE [Candidatus Thioglobus sp.]|jgi:tRNA modification GTPase|nr:tRNA uridine-5-carboxymethylaminomethyl(34) synthesis GTPase MnmE [Candidatus Thioglobus sp.]
MKKTETICALATAVGQSGIGIVRISGPLSQSIAKQVLNVELEPRVAYYGDFCDQEGDKVDRGVAIFFPSPNSYTGEDILELQGHGGMSVLRCLLETASHFGARLAEPGEFSKRAFLNGKMDLVQAEAVQDLIQASSDQSARCAVRSLSGEFSAKINNILSSIISLRVFVEATIDFSDEEIDFLESHEVLSKIESLKQELQDILDSASQGAILREGLHVAIAGKPNAGKSSLLNSLTKQPSAIVTDIAGTTRDILKETIQIDGLPLHIIDTAGLHNSDDIIEKEGIRRAHAEIDSADVVLLVYEAQEQSADYSILSDLMTNKPIVTIRNKIDLLGEEAGITEQDKQFSISLSAKTGNGVELLRELLIRTAGYNPVGEEVFLARKRHLLAIASALKYIKIAVKQLESGASELVAEDLRQASMSLGAITGEFSSDDLLGEIFSSFCIGK